MHGLKLLSQTDTLNWKMFFDVFHGVKSHKKPYGYECVFLCVLFPPRPPFSTQKLHHTPQRPLHVS